MAVKRKVILAVAVVVIVVVASVAAYYVLNQKTPPVQVTLGMPVQGYVASYFPIDVLGGSNINVLDLGQPKWSDYGLDVTVQYATGSGQLMQFASSGQLQIGAVTTTPLLVAQAGGAQIKAVGVTDPTDVDTRIIAPVNGKVKTLADLKNGVTLAVTNPNSQSDIYAKIFAAKHNLTIGKDIIVKYLGSARADAITSGSVDASIDFDPGALQLVQAGKAITVATGPDFLSNIQTNIFYNVFWASNSYIQSNPTVVKHVIQAYYAAVAWARTHENQTVQIEAQRWNVSPTLAKAVFENVMPRIPQTSTFSCDSFSNTISALIQTGLLKQSVDCSQIATMQFVPTGP